ncbi:MAG: molybdopterin-dependent oxidoreductase [Nocardioidaceae bacterium]
MWRTKWAGALLGVVSAGTGLAVSELLSGWLHLRISPLVALSEWLIRLTPGSWIEFGIQIFGKNDKPALITLTLLGLIIASVAIGFLALRSLVVAQGVFAVLGIVLVLAVHVRLASTPTTFVPAVAGAGAAMITLAALIPKARIAARSPGAAEPESPAVGGDSRGLAAGSTTAVPTSARRDFLKLAGAVALGAVVAGATGRMLARSRAALETARRKLNLAATPGTQPAGVTVGLAGITPWRTSQDDFYRIDTALSVPQILPADWRLRIHGLVDREVTLTYQDLLDRGITEAWVTLCCVSNEVGGDLISNAWWSGVRIADVLAEAGPSPDADAVLSTSEDDWTCGTPIGALTDDRHALLAVAMNGQPLTPEHGFPVRMVVPGLYGYVSATKWVVDMEVTRFSDIEAFWTSRGWSEEGPVKTQSRIDVPMGGGTVKAGDVAVGGIAWAQHTGIARVQVRVDDGQWQEAKLGEEPTTDSWRQWSYVWPATGGDHQIQVRATDASGYTQTGQETDVVPNGATGWHSIDVTVS